MHNSWENGHNEKTKRRKNKIMQAHKSYDNCVLFSNVKKFAHIKTIQGVGEIFAHKTMQILQWWKNTKMMTHSTNEKCFVALF